MPPGPGRADVTWHAGELSRVSRWEALGSRGATVWFTGLSGSGKSTIAAAVERRLVGAGVPAYRLDGDNLRLGLNADLGFGAEDRRENVRRVAHVARLLADAGMVALTCLISPYAEGRREARRLHVDAGLEFVEVFVDTPLAECQRRDPKGLYARARTGDLTGLTGVDDPYEPPEAAEVVVAGASPGVEGAAGLVLDALGRRGIGPGQETTSP